MQPCKQRPGLVLPCLSRTHRWSQLEPVQPHPSQRQHHHHAGEGCSLTLLCWHREQMGCTALWGPPSPDSPSPDSTRAPRSGTRVLVRMSSSPAPPTNTHTRLFRPGTSILVHQEGPIHSHVHPTTGISQEAFIYRDVPRSEPGSCPTPSSAPQMLLEAQRGSQPSKEHAGVSSKHAACTQHTRSSRWVSSGLGPGLGPGTGMDQTGPKLGPISQWENSRTGTPGSQHVPWSARACSKGRWENEEMENRICPNPHRHQQTALECPQKQKHCISVQTQ